MSLRGPHPVTVTAWATVGRLATCLPWVALLSGSLCASQPVEHVPGDPQSGGTVVARVDGSPILEGEVCFELKRRRSGQADSVPADAILEAAVLEHLIQRCLVLQYLAQQGLGASQQDIDFQLRQQQRRLAERGEELAEHLRKQGLTENAWRRRIAWRLGWPRYLQRYSGEQYLKKQFDSRPRDYDGTRLRVAHILLPLSRTADPRQRESARRDALRRAEVIRREIEGGKFTFAEAAGMYSEAPTAERGGELGLISRPEPMPESFSRAAFALRAGQTSPPVVSPFGVHLIHCLEVEPGTLGWQDVRDTLRKDVARRVFDALVQYQRKRAGVEYTGTMPYLDADSGRLVRAPSPTDSN
jgi:parvulin-like peptidyl-prolyl isomerase